MKLHVIVLAQGRQSRLPDLGLPKQMLPLPAVGCAILERTLFQIEWLTGHVDRLHVTVIGHDTLRERLASVAGRAIHVVTLPNPGNSSLMGVQRYLWTSETEENRPDLPRHVYHNGIPDIWRADRTVVLLGDVVYSWRCITSLLGESRVGDDHTNPVFSSTSDLSPSTGELWGIMWPRASEAAMRDAMVAAMQHHPSQSTYQPGQLRRWMWTIASPVYHWEPIQDGMAAMRAQGLWVPCDDYTRDIDTPAHVAMLPKISELALADDVAQGVTIKADR